MPHTGEAIAPARRDAVIALRSQGHSILQISKRLRMGRSTIDAILSRSILAQDGSIREHVERIVPKALQSIESKVLTDGNLAMRFVEYALPHDAQSINVNMGDGSRLAIATGLLPGPSTPMSTSTTESTGSAVSTGPTEAPANMPSPAIAIGSPTNFSQFSTADLEAELERRHSRVIEAEVVVNDSGVTAAPEVPK